MGPSEQPLGHVISLILSKENRSFLAVLNETSLSLVTINWRLSVRIHPPRLINPKKTDERGEYVQVMMASSLDPDLVWSSNGMREQGGFVAEMRKTLWRARREKRFRKEERDFPLMPCRKELRASADVLTARNKRGTVGYYKNAVSGRLDPLLKE